MSTSNGEMVKKEAVGRVVGDSQRLSWEKETSLRFNREEKVVHVSSFDPTIIKNLLKHELFEVDNYSKNQNSMIIGVSGHFPRGLLKVKKKPRKRDYLSTIISSEASEG